MKAVVTSARCGAGRGQESGLDIGGLLPWGDQLACPEGFPAFLGYILPLF